MLGEGGDEVPTIEEADAAAEKLRRLLRLQHRLLLRAAELAGILERADYGELRGSVSTPDWIRHECDLGFQAAADLVTVGLEMDSLAQTVSAVEQGEIGFQHLVYMARTQSQLHGQPIEEEHLLAEAKEVSVGRFWHLCQHARHAADAAQMAEEQAIAGVNRRLRLNQQQDGTVTVSGILDQVGGAAVQAALEPLARKTGDPYDGRDKQERLADALIELAGHALDQGSPRQRPHLNVTATLGTVLRIPRSAAAEVDHGAPVTEITVGRIACDCAITRHIFDSEGVLVELGREKRVISPALRKSIEARDRHCRWPGCERPGSWCEAHHVVPWLRGGGTNLENLVLLCTRHHWQVHEGRWELFLEAQGRIKVVRPPIDFRAQPRAPAALRAA